MAKVKVMKFIENQKNEFRKEQIKEALKRMRKLQLHDNVISDFEEDGTINRSEYMGFLYWLSDEEKSIINKWERQTGNLVYHIIKNHFEFGLCYSFLYVSKHKDEWELDNKDIDLGYVLAYVKNIDCPDFSEYGSIGIKKINGGLVRKS